jgi:hypothetical protein
LPPAGARPDAADAWRSNVLTDRELTIATVVSVLLAVLVPYIGFMLGLVLIADRHIPNGIAVLAVALLASPLFPLWQGVTI